MKKAILAKKIGMTQIFGENGEMIPVTVLEAGPCTVVQKKTVETDGYEAVQVGFENRKQKYTAKSNKVNKPMLGHFTKAGLTEENLLRYVREFRLEDAANYEVGNEIKVDIFAAGELVDVTGTSKGKGFQGAIKRHNQSRGPMAHGSHYHRAPGSMGSSASPSKVRKGKKLPGHMGNKTVTVQSLEIVKVDAEKNLLLIKGAVPGPKNTIITVKDAVKHA